LRSSRANFVVGLPLPTAASSQRRILGQASAVRLSTFLHDTRAFAAVWRQLASILTLHDPVGPKMSCWCALYSFTLLTSVSPFLLDTLNTDNFLGNLPEFPRGEKQHFRNSSLDENTAKLLSVISTNGRLGKYCQCRIRSLEFILAVLRLWTSGLPEPWEM
jgi:hypothetical protein